MGSHEHYYNPYERLAPVYDWMARLLLAPFGGERAFRTGALSELGIFPGARVLELGCGTGAMTEVLVGFGADVTAVDLSEPMLARARRRAPAARFLNRDILGFEAAEPYDFALFSFVLHEMDPETRRRALEVASSALGQRGVLGVLDFSSDAPPVVDTVFRAYLRLAEPEMAQDLLRDGVSREVERAGFVPVRSRSLGLGTAAMVVAQRGAPLPD